MKILHITAMSQLSPNSGIPAVLKQLTDAQNKIEGVESIVLSLCGEVDKLDSHYFYFIANESIEKFLERYKPDLAVIHSFFHVEHIKAVKALKRNNIPFFIEPHGSFGENAMKKGALKKRIANSTIFRPQIKDSSGYIYTNQAEKNDSIYRKEKVLVIPNGIVPEVVYSANKKNVISYNEPVFYFLGRYDIHHKGLDYLFDALDILEEKKYLITLKLYGTGNKKQLEYVNSRIKKYAYISVSNCGTIYGEAKKEALELANILVLTSRYEGSPMTVLDGLSYGNPCIVTPGTNVADEVSQNSIGWQCSLKAESIADTIIKAVEDYRTQNIDYIDRCKKYVLENYSWDKIAEYSIGEYSRAIK